MGNASLTFVAGQLYSCCAKFCSDCMFRSVLAASMQEIQGYRKLLAQLSCDLYEKNSKKTRLQSMVHRRKYPLLSLPEHL